MMEGFGLRQQVLEPTQRSGHTLDHVFVNEFQLAIKHEVIGEDMGLTTDHFPILLELPFSNIHAKTQTMLYRNVKNVNTEAFRRDLMAA